MFLLFLHKGGKPPDFYVCFNSCLRYNLYKFFISTILKICVYFYERTGDCVFKQRNTLPWTFELNITYLDKNLLNTLSKTYFTK